MRRILFLCIVILTIPKIIAHEIDSVKTSIFSVGFKVGANHSVIIINQERDYLFERAQNQNSFLLGFSANAFVETKLSNYISLLTELSYKRINSEIKGSTDSEGIKTNKFFLDYIGFSVLPKFELSNSFFPYLLAGLDFGYLIQAEYKWYDEIYYEGGVKKIKNELPSITTSLCLGLGKKFAVYNLNFIAEVRFLFGLTNYEVESFEKFKQNEFYFLIGMPIF